MKRLNDRSFQKRVGISTATFNFLRSKLQLWPAGLLAVLFSIPFAALALSDVHQHRPSANSQAATPDVSQQSSVDVRADTSQTMSPSNNISSESSTSINSDAEANVEVKVNGQPVEVPENGSVHKVITNENGNNQTVIDIETNESSSGNSSRQSVSGEIKSTGGGTTSIIVESSD